MFRVISREEACIHHDAAKNSREAEPNDAPVIAGSAAAARLPSVHPFPASGVFIIDKNRRRWLQQTFLGREKFVVRLKYAATEALRSEVRQFGEIAHAPPRRNTWPIGLAENSPRSKIFLPLKKVVSTTPASSRPA